MEYFQVVQNDIEGVHMDDQQTQYQVLDNTPSYVINEASMIYQESPLQIQPNHQQPQISTIYIQQDDDSILQHHHQQQMQHIQHQQPQQIYYTNESQPVQHNQIIQHDPQQQQQQQAPQQIVYQVPQQQTHQQPITSQQVMMSPAQVVSQTNQHIIVQQQSPQHLVIQQQQSPHQMPHQQPQQTPIVVRAPQRVVYKAQNQNIIYQQQISAQPQIHQQTPNPTGRFVQQQAQRPISSQPQPHSSPTHNIVFHPVQQPKTTPPPPQPTPPLTIGQSRMPGTVTVTRPRQAVAPNTVRIHTPRNSVRPVKHATPQNVTITSPPNAPAMVTSQRGSRARLTTPGGGRGSRGGRGARTTNGQIRMMSPSSAPKLTLIGATTSSQQELSPEQTAGSPQKTLSPQQVQVQQKLLNVQTQKARMRQVTTTRPVMPMSQSDDIEDSIQASSISKPTDLKPLNEVYDTTLTQYATQDDNTLQRQGQPIPLSEYKRSQQQQQQKFQISRTFVRGTTPTPFQQQHQIPVNRVAPMQQQSPKPNPEHLIQTQQIIQNRIQNADQSSDNVERGNARMLVILASGEQRLITFTLPRDSCTVQELLEQVNVPFDNTTTIQCVSSKGANIDYVVTVGIPLPPPEHRAEWILNAEQSLMNSKQQEQQQAAAAAAAQAAQQQQQQAAAAAQAAQQQALIQQQQQQQLQQVAQKVSTVVQQCKHEEIPTPKLIKGFLAVCKYCGTCSPDFAKCDRCKRSFTEEPRRVPMHTAKALNNSAVTSSVEEKKRIQNELLTRAQAKSIATSNAPNSRGRTISIQTRGRGRGGISRSSRAQAELEPVILTLSSDDEADDDRASSLSQQSIADADSKLDKPLECEPFISSELVPQSEENITSRPNVADLTDCFDKIATNLICKLIRIGTHRFETKEKVVITSKGIRIIAPSCVSSEEKICLDIREDEIVKVIVHFEKQLPVAFIYVNPRCGYYIRESLEMQSKLISKEKPFFSPIDRNEYVKRICLQIDNNFTEENRAVMKAIFRKEKFEEICQEDAKILLARSSSKDKMIRIDSSSSLAKADSDQNIRQLMIYPQGRGGISINTEDYMCLAIDQYLNDVIIDFYLKYVHLHLQQDPRDRTHIFSTFFYKRLTTMTTRQRQNKDDAKLTAAQKRHARVASWTKNVNIFEKDFIIIPINEQSHWFLAIICFPNLRGPVSYDKMQPVIIQPAVKKKKSVSEKKLSVQIGSTTITPLSKRGEIEAAVHIGDDESERDEAEGDESDLASDDSDSESVPVTASTPNTSVVGSSPNAIKQPIILIFDSLSGASRSRVVATLRDYLTCEYQAKNKDGSKLPRTFDKTNMPGHCVKVPQQNNFTDCGLYVLQYVEHFFTDPIRDYKTPIKQLINWFETIIVTRKREEISNLLKDLVEKQHPDRLPLPDILFPTLDGKLVEQEFTDEQAEFEEDEFEEEAEEEEDENAVSKSKVNGSNNKEVVLKRTISEIVAGKSGMEPATRKLKLDSS